MIKHLFLDLDDTILDFHKAEAAALSQTLREQGLEPTGAVLHRYHLINKMHWEQLERGELTREEVLTGRFRVLFAEFQIPTEAEETARKYEQNLALGHDFLPGALEAVQCLARKYDLYLASNGTATVQHRRLTDAELYPYFKKVFISEHIGFNKPSIDYFNACFREIPNFQREHAVMVGDSLTSDILGGINAGLRTVWIAPKGTAPRPDISPDFRLGSVTELEALLETL